MSNYTKTTNFSTKDALPSGNPAKIVKGTEIDTEFNNIATAVATKSNTADPTFTGTVTAPVVVASTSINIAGDGATVTGIKDEDDMASNSATKLATQQSIKAYVDSQVTAQDLDVTDGTTSISIDLDSEALSLLGGTGIDSTASGNGVTMAIDSTVATLTGTQTLTNKTLTSPDVNTPDIDGGTIDGTVIGGTTAAAGSFTTVGATGNITVGGTVDGRDVATDGTKLDGIEAGATADQTAAEIKTAYESNANTNAFTDADESKLDGIEAGADVTDTANVTAAGALMDSELTNITAVKALNQGVATTDSPSFVGLTASGEITANGGIALGDNDKATFGAGDDLQIYHDGSSNSSYIKETGTGSFNIEATNLFLKREGGTESFIDCVTNGAVTAYYDGSAKLATTATGIDVTGKATMDVLDASGTGVHDLQRSHPTTTASLAVLDLKAKSTGDMAAGFGAAARFIIEDTANVENVVAEIAARRESSDSTAALTFTTLATERMRIDSSGNVGIGNTSPYSPLSVTTTGTLPQDKYWYEQVNMLTLNGTRPRAGLSTAATAGGNAYDGDMLFYNMYYDGGADYQWKERMRITSNGNVGIGTSSPSQLLHLTSPGFAYARFNNSSFTGIDIGQHSGGNIYFNNRDNTSIIMQTNNTERMRIDSAGRVLIGITGASGFGQLETTTFTTTGQCILARTGGNVGIGTSSPSAKLHVQSASSGGAASGNADELILEGSGNTGLTILSGATSLGNLFFADSGDAADGFIQYDQSGRSMHFGTSAAERMRIDSAGNLLVGKSATGFGTAGIELRSNGELWATTGVTNSASFNRTGSYGPVVYINSANTPIGNIGSTTGDGGATTMYIADQGNVGIRFDQASTDDIQPCTSTGANRDNAINLGALANRFKDLYLSGGVYQNGTRLTKRTSPSSGGSGIFASITNAPQTGFVHIYETGTDKYLILACFKKDTSSTPVTNVVANNGLTVNATNAGGTIAIGGHTSSGNVKMQATIIREG